MCFKKAKFDLVGHPECDHHFVHNAGKQCEWDRAHYFNSNYAKGDSKRIAYMYICTRCGGEFWSSDKALDIPHYRVKDIRKKGR